MAYLRRIVDGELQQRLASAGAVLIEGPKSCGKTETARQQAQRIVFLDTDPRARAPGVLAEPRDVALHERLCSRKADGIATFRARESAFWEQSRSRLL